MGNVLTDARELEWSTAKTAAERIIRICQDAGFTAPEAIDLLRGKVQLVCMEIDQIVAALRIMPPAAPAAALQPIAIGPADTAIIDRALAHYSKDYKGAPHAEIARIRAALTGTVLS